MYENAPLVDTPRVVLESGVSAQDLRIGDGEEVTQGKRVNIQWSLKRSNGYIIDSSANNDGVPFIFIVGDTKGQRAIPGLDEGIRGMRVGGICRIVIPPSLSFVEGLEEGRPGPIPLGFGPKQRIKRVMENRMDVPDESFMIDVKATRVQ
jgi:FKBP-type peptidyl-prolyl cis-trans isomerase